MLNKEKICFWRRVCSGRYRIGDITVEEIWHPEGTGDNRYMWHVIVEGQTVETWAYLKDAKRAACKIDRRCQEL